MATNYDDIAVIIPARLDSNRLPRKTILDLSGKPVVQHVYERCQKSQLADKIWIATDHLEIAKIAARFTRNIIMTSTDHTSGTSRIAEAIKQVPANYIINVQGDEVFIDPALIDNLALTLKKNAPAMASAAFLSSDLAIVSSLNSVKVVVDKNMDAIYFSRQPIPYHFNKAPDELKQYWIHIGIYGYSRKFLKDYVAWPASQLEDKERLEQLRAIYNGVKIKIVKYHQPLGPAIDTNEDLARAIMILKKNKR